MAHPSPFQYDKEPPPTNDGARTCAWPSQDHAEAGQDSSDEDGDGDEDALHGSFVLVPPHAGAAP